MASTRRKSAAIALAVIGIAGLSLAAAATLTVNNATLQAGTSLTAACDADGVVGVAYTTSFDAGEYVVDSLAITGVDAACVGEDIEVTLVAANGTDTVVLTEQEIVSSVDPSWDATDAPTFDMADIYTVAVIISS